MDLIKELNKEALQKETANVQVGDTVRVHVKVKEGSRERIQVFEGTVIAKKHGGIEETVTVRRVSYGIGSPSILLPSTTLRSSATVRSVAPSCTICVAAWARAPRSRRSCNQLSVEQKKRGESLSFFVIKI